MSDIKTVVTNENKIQLRFNTDGTQPIIQQTDESDAVEFAKYLLDAANEVRKRKGYKSFYKIHIHQILE